jgi:hypothetical protein
MKLHLKKFSQYWFHQYNLNSVVSSSNFTGMTMKARKKFVSLLVILIFVLTFLYGCSVGGSDASSVPDTNAPSVPTSLVTQATSASQINLTWTASTDDIGVTGYKIYRDGVYLQSVSATSTTDTGMVPYTQYCYQVTAYDTAGNESAKCMQVCAAINSYRIYSFEGVISNFGYDGAGIIANEGYKIGDRVFAKFNVDFVSDGYYILNNGEKLIPENPQMTNNPYWWFYADLIDGTLMPVMNGGFNNDPTNIKEYHIGYLNSGPSGNTGALQGGTGNSYFAIRKYSYTDASVQNWVIGDHLNGIIVSWSDKDWSIMGADMILTDIQIIP